MEKRYGTVGIPVVDMEVRFLKPCRLQYDVTVEASAVEWHSKRFKVRHRVFRADDLLVECVETRFWGVRHPDNPDRLVSADIPPEVAAALMADPQS
jgi:4-hydroxybenzoyl-CoA thioesterase